MGEDSGARDLTLDLCINEFMPENDAALLDEAGGSPDWIELHNPGDSDLDLEGWSLTDDREDPGRSPLPAGLSLEAGAFLLLYADANPPAGPDHLGFALSSDGGEVGVYSPDGVGSIIAYGSLAADFSVARSPDCCVGEGCLDYQFRGTPGYSNVPVVVEEVELFPRASVWAYADTGTIPGPSWAAPGYDDSGWGRGAGPLGYGDSQTTVVSYGPDAANKYVTTWFRVEVTVTGVEALTDLDLDVDRDDGVIVYLNGVEVLRSNLPEGDVAPSTLATTSIGDAAETTYYRFAIDPGALVEGRNVLAAEVHQASADSSDLTFDLGMVGGRISGG